MRADEVLDVTQLVRLVCDFNYIQAIPIRLCLTMTSLTELWVSQNEISKVPRELCERCTSLVSLRLNDNHIVQIPLQIGNLTLLEEIRLHGNRITILPLEMGLLQKVKSPFPPRVFFSLAAASVENPLNPPPKKNPDPKRVACWSRPRA